jgi:NADH-quinone oxidoreductase subunit L
VPGLAGFFSKDEILFHAFDGGHTVLWSIGLLTSLLTAVYMFRVVFLTFHGEPGTVASPERHAHDAPPAMALALIVLAIGSVAAGYVGFPAALGGGDWFARFLGPSFHVEAGHEAVGGGLELTLMAVSSGVAIAGIGIAIYFFLRNKAAADAMAERFSGAYRVLLNKYYVDEVYDATIVQPVRIVSEEGLWKIVDVGVIDGGVNGIGRLAVGLSDVLRRAQTGSVRTYAVSLLVGVVAIVGYYLWP